MNKNPCVICEKYMKGVRCEEKECPVYQMKEENEKLRKLADNASREWEYSSRDRIYEMGEC